MTEEVPESVVEDASAEGREFILTLGGFAVQLAGGSLVTHERVPVPAFNYVEVRGVARERSSPFFERALDHYFQRALRPQFRLPLPVAAHLDEHLRRLGFRRRSASHALLMAAKGPPAGALPLREVGLAESAELDVVIGLFADEKERAELRRAVEVAWHAPHPGESTVPVVFRREGKIVAAGLRHTYRGIAGMHLIVTQSASRGRGAATALIQFAKAAKDIPGLQWVSVESDDPRLVDRLAPLGFHLAREWAVYELPPSAQLTMPDPGPPSPPRWRPPRRPRAP